MHSVKILFPTSGKLWRSYPVSGNGFNISGIGPDPATKPSPSNSNPERQFTKVECCEHRQGGAFLRLGDYQILRIILYVLPRNLRPMRLSRRPEPFHSDEFIYESKIDGRCSKVLIFVLLQSSDSAGTLSFFVSGPVLGRPCGTDKDPYRNCIATPAAWKLLAFEDRALCVMASGMINAGDTVDAAGECWRFAHADWDTTPVASGERFFIEPVAAPMCHRVIAQHFLYWHISGSAVHL